MTKVKILCLAALALLAAGAAHANGGDSAMAVSGLPHAEGRSFETLDAYLAHLEQLGTIGITWYQRMPDGRYQLIRRRPPGEAPQIFTRAELAARFGFAE